MRRDEGFTLVELLVSMLLMTIVLGSVLTTFDGFNQHAARTTRNLESQDAARRAVDRIVDEVRNATSASVPTLVPLERAAPYDLVFQSIGYGAATTGNPTRRIRVRYCLDTADAANGKLIRQSRTFTGAPTQLASTDTACPLAGWDSTSVVADRVTNRHGGANRPLFSYRFNPAASTSLTELVGVSTSAFVDVTPGVAAPPESVLRSGVILRNANQPPLSLFSMLAQGRTVQLNATASSDPEQQPLTYEWFVNGVTNANLRGVRVQTQQLPAGTHSIRLVVTDTGGATDERTQTITLS
jgi:prepilin-type N-terminal cleavage/methylation domain-containing protein